MGGSEVRCSFGVTIIYLALLLLEMLDGGALSSAGKQSRSSGESIFVDCLLLDAVRLRRSKFAIQLVELRRHNILLVINSNNALLPLIFHHMALGFFDLSLEVLEPLTKPVRHLHGRVVFCSEILRNV